MADVFISYSRKDKDFVRALHDALAKQNRDTWVDWEDIPGGAEWEQRVFGAIEAAKNLVFVLSPDSVTSEHCGQELAHAVQRPADRAPLLGPLGRGLEARLLDAGNLAHRPERDRGDRGCRRRS